MNLTASAIVHNERGRYLEPWRDHLREFCDQIRVIDDHSDDGTLDHLSAHGAYVAVLRGGRMFDHEGRARQQLLEWTLKGEPSHVLAIDADEFVSDGQELRTACAQGGQAFSLDLQEVWAADERSLGIRQDGQWRAQQRIACVYAVPEKRDQRWRIMNRQLACGREPMAVRQIAPRAVPTGVALLHFGWANEAQRVDRYQRYVVADGGRFHNKSHLDSILWPDRRIRLSRRSWPEALEPYKAAILDRVHATVTA